MTNSIGIPVRLISYGFDGVNRVGLNPLSGRLDDNSPRGRELWAATHSKGNLKAREFGATYGDTVTEYSAPVGTHAYPIDIPERGIKIGGEVVPAHEDIFDTVELPRIEAHEPGDILLSIDPEDDVVFTGTTHRNMVL